MRVLILIFCFLANSNFGQPLLRKNISLPTNLVLNRLDSIIGNSNTLEFRTIGEANYISHSYLAYAELIKVANENEVLLVLNNKK